MGFRWKFLRILYTCVILTLIGCTKEQSDWIDAGPIRLQNITRQADLHVIGPTFGAVAVDLNNDGRDDLLVSNHGIPSIYLNVAGEKFQLRRDLLEVGSGDRHAPAPGDYDNDGDEDLFFPMGAHKGTSSQPKEFFVNEGPTAGFIKRSIPVIEDPLGRGRTAVWFDYDGDGFLDLFLANTERADAPNRLFRNLGNGEFEDISAKSKVDRCVRSEGGAAAVDIDRDGDMDLILTNSQGPPFLLIRQQDGTFRDEASARGIPKLSGTWSLGLADINGDGAIDLYVSRGTGSIAEGALLSDHRLNYGHLVNDRDRFDLLSFKTSSDAAVEFSFETGLVDPSAVYVGAGNRNPFSAMGKRKRLVFHFQVGKDAFPADGRPSQLTGEKPPKGTYIWRDPVTNRWTVATSSGGERYHSAGLITSPSQLSDLKMENMENTLDEFPNVLLKNNGDGTFVDATRVAGVGDPANSRSALWVDLDNDADLDLFLVNAGFTGAGNQENACYVNEGTRFRRYAIPLDAEEKLGRGDAGLIADFNNDGYEDIFVTNGSGVIPGALGPYLLYRNLTRNSNHWIAFRLEGLGKDYTNRDAVGAAILVETDQRKQWSFVLGGSGSYSQSSRILHFGLGSARTANVTVFWPPGRANPNGHQQSYSFSTVQMNRIHRITEGPQSGS